jgi:hypothetical protein
MVLPPEIVYKIISYVPQTSFRGVSKDWKSEIDYILGKSVKKIEKWYKNRKTQDDYNTIKELVRYYVVHYPDEFFIRHPEFAVKKLGMNISLLDVIPSQPTRKRSDVRDWMLNLPIQVNDWAYIGW